MDGRAYPYRKVELQEGATDWKEEMEIGGRPGERRGVGVFVVGPPGLALIRYLRESTKRHDGWMDKLEVPKDANERYLPALTRELMDAVKFEQCDVVWVERPK
jgi:hypothetical protein